MMAGTHLASPPVASRQISGKFPAANPSAWDRQDHPNGPAAVAHLGHVQVP